MLTGGDGDDTLSDGDRDGAAANLAPGPDTLDGGPGLDTLSYRRRTRGVVVNLAAGDPVAQLHGFLDRVLDSQRERNCVGGCPMGNLASELSDVHEGFRRRLAEIFSEWRVRLAEALARGKARGGLRADVDPARAAQFLVAALEGAILMSKVTRDIAVMESCVDELKRHLTLYAEARS